MPCPPCESTATTERAERTNLGYLRVRCRDGGRGFHDRTGTLCHRLQSPTAVVCLVVRWRFRDTLRLRAFVAMCLPRGLLFTHDAVRERESQRAPLRSETLRRRRPGAVGKSWDVAATDSKVQGQGGALYRAIDRDGPVLDARLSEPRDLAAAEACFRAAWPVTGVAPARITTDGHDADPRAIRQGVGNRVVHRTTRALQTHLEQDHRGIQPRDRPMGGCTHGHPAARGCRPWDDVRAFLRPQSQRHQPLSRAQRRDSQRDRVGQLMAILVAASSRSKRSTSLARPRGAKVDRTPVTAPIEFLGCSGG
jgi:putative transposase